MTESKTLQQLLQAADANLTAVNHALPVWEIPGYYWDTAGHTAAKRLMEADVQTAYTTALAYRWTGRSAYADKAKELLHAWASVNQSIAGHDGPLVSAYLGAGLLQAAGWLQAYPGWTREDQDRFTGWMTRVCLPEWESIPIRNNWWNWSLYARLALFRLTGDYARFEETAVQLKEHIDSSLSPDGLIPEETMRGNKAIWYHYFALAPATAAAKLIRDVTGEDLFHWTSPGGKSLKKALDTLFYYAVEHSSEWPYEKDQSLPEPFASDTWPVDLFEAMSMIYDEPDYERFVAPHRPVIGNRNRNTGFFHSYAWNYPELQF
ncbi:alginate lyase family protein [Gorillibacterium sp. sgz5001074]|uniref:alginate lyase family protein n=1 Tax=Gorillibacterium sp. sgz5001074 TaxID=3446695 RepID=UPI003F676833